MVTPEEIARAMAVHSVGDEPRRSTQGDTEVLVDEEPVNPHAEESDSERDAGQGTIGDVASEPTALANPRRTGGPRHRNGST
jgi:hypothetical protein